MKNAMRLLSVFLTVVMIFGVVTSVPFNVSAAQTGEQSDTTLASETDEQVSSVSEAETNEQTTSVLPTADDEQISVDEEETKVEPTTMVDDVKDNVPIGANSGKTGDCTWSVSDGVLTISGQGKMADYIRGNNGGPWSKTITSVVVEPGVTYIGNYAFYKCTKLQSADVPGSVTAIGEAAFSECSALLKFTIPDGIKTISNSTFKGCSSLVELNIPDSVTSINSFAMNGCKSLTEIYIPYGIKTISANTFSGCSSITNFSIPNSVTTIGDYAFYNCSGITVFSIPESVTTIGDYTFSSCPAITDFSFPDSVTTIGQYVFDNCGKLKSVKLPKNSTTISKGLLARCKSITEITIPNGITTINDEVFKECTSLKNVSIPDTVTKIGASVFYKCTNLSGIVIPNSVTTIGAHLFDNCTSLESIIIPNSIKSIPNMAFTVCSSLTSVTIPESVTSIGESAFRECSVLENISIPNSVKSIGKLCFYECKSLKSIVIPDGVSIINENTFCYCQEMTEITIPDSVTEIGQYAFSNCKKLESIELPQNIKTINKGTFNSCSALTEIIIPDGVTLINQEAFKNCNSLKNIIIPDSVTKIGDYAFYNCYKIPDIAIPNSVTSLGNYLFESCTSLRRIVVPNQIKTIPNFAFYKCSSLLSVTIPKSVTTIGTAAFRECTVLEGILIPDSVTTIGGNAFWKCTSLKSIVIPDSVKTLGDATVFIDCIALKEVKLSNKLKTLAAGTFNGCKALENLVVPSSVNTIGQNLCYNCTSLRTITIPDSVSSIGKNAFYNCKNFTIRCVPESYAERYAINNNYDYTYMHIAYDGTLTVKAIEDYEGYIISVTDKTNKTITRQITDGSCAFSFINPEMGYTISLLNKYGRTIAQKTLDSLKNGNSEVIFRHDNLFTANVIVKTEDGSVVSDYSVEWFVNGSAAAESTAASLRFLNTGDSVTCRVKLGESLKKFYENPSDITKEIFYSNETFLFQAKRAATKDVTVKVVNEKGEAVPSANVSIVQQIDSSKNRAENYTTNENGILNVSLRKIQTTIKATDASFYAVNWNGIPEESEITLTLKSAVGASFVPNVTYRYIENTIHADMTDVNLNSLTFNIFNVTKGAPVTNYTYNNNRLTIPFEEINKGDQLDISVTDSDHVFANAQTRVTYNNNAEYFDLKLAEMGKAAFDYTSQNKDNIAMIFNVGGACVDVVELSEKNLSSGLAAGSYTVVLMGYSELFVDTPNIAYLNQYGLLEGTHYIKFDVTVSDCEITTLNKKKIPTLDENEVAIIDSTKSYLSLSSDKFNIKKNISVTANYDISERHKYLYDVKGVEIVLPEGATVGSKVNIDGRYSDEYSFDGTKITVPVNGQQGKILASVRWKNSFDSESVDVYAYLLLEKDNKTYRQPIGKASMTGNMIFNVPSVTANTTISVYGSVSSKSTVDIFVDDVHQITVQSSQSGRFDTTVELNNTSKHSFHQVYFEVSGAASSYRSKTYYVEYDRQAVCLDAIYISPNGHMGKSVKIYSADGNFNDSYYVFPLYSTLTFKVEFTGDVSRLKNVVLVTSTNSGKKNYIKLNNIEGSNSFTGSHTFKDDFPDFIEVIYDYDSDYPLDWEEVKQNQEEYRQSIDGVNDSLEEFKNSLNNLTDEEKAEFTEEAMKDVVVVDDDYNVYQKADGTIVLQNDDGFFGFKAREWYDKTKTESVLINEGYKKIKTTNPSDAVYVLNNQYENITADLNTHHFTAVYFDDDPKDDDAVGWGPAETGLADAGLLTSLLSQLTQKYRAVQNFAETQEANSVAWRRIFGEKSALVASLEQQQGTGFAELAQKAAQEAEHARKLAETFDVFGKLLNKLLLVVNLIQLHQDTKFCVSMVDKLADMKEEYDYDDILNSISHCADAELEEFMKAITDFRSKLIVLKIALTVAMTNTILQFAAMLAGPLSLTAEVIVAAIGLVTAVFQDLSKTEVEQAYATALFWQDAVTKALLKCGQGPRKRRNLKKKLDPSGYVYEAVPSNKLSDVTVTAFFSENPDGSDAEIWDAEEYDQKNPLYTDNEGHYEWYVPDGYWQVRCEKDGYLTAYSDWLPVPPPQTDVNIPMVSLEAPKLLYTNAYSDSIEFEFSQYMDPDTFNHQTVKVFSDGEPVNGDIIPLNSERSLNGKYYTKRFAFVPADNSQLSGNVEAEIQSVENYAGLSINTPYQKSLEIVERVTEIKSEENLTFQFGESATAVVQFDPAEAAAGRTVTVKVDNTSILEVKTDKVTVDKNGKAVVDFNQLLPGKATVTYILDGTDLTSKTTVVCVPEKEQLPRVTASIESGSMVSKGTKLELFCDNPDAKIYYTLDLSCPCQENNTERKLYTGPIEITEDTQLIAYAILDGYEDSKTRLFTYTVSNSLIGDVNRDGTVDILDATVVQKYAVDMTTLTNEQKELGDVNNDKIVDILDATMIQKYAVDKITAFPKAA